MSKTTEKQGENGWQWKPIYSASDLIKMGFGSRKHVYNQLQAGQIPRFWVGKRCFIPGVWVHQRMCSGTPDPGI